MPEYRVPYKDIPWFVLMAALIEKVVYTFFARPFHAVMSRTWLFALVLCVMVFGLFELVYLAKVPDGHEFFLDLIKEIIRS